MFVVMPEIVVAAYAVRPSALISVALPFPQYCARPG